MQSSFLRNAVVLGLLCAIGPFAIDMYLPALPAIAGDLGASIGTTQLTLMAFFVTFGLGQIVYGPVSDAVGRKPPIYFGLVLFTLASIGCALAPTVEWLIAFRVIQGIGACTGVIALAIVRDLHTGVAAARLMSLIILVFSVSPILAPLSGSAIIEVFDWRGIFYAVAVAGVLGVLLVAVFLPETRPPAERIRNGFRSIMSGYGRLLGDRRFLALTFIAGLGMASFFAFLASSSFVYIDHFGLTPTEYSFAFSVNAIGFVGSAQLNGYLGSRFGLVPVVRMAVTGYAVFAAILFAVALAGLATLPVIIVLLFISFAFLGLVIPSIPPIALEDHGPIAGTASALMGTLQMISGAALMGVVSFFFDGTALPMITAIVLCAAGTFVLAQVTLRDRAEPAPQPAE